MPHLALLFLSAFAAEIAPECEPGWWQAFGAPLSRPDSFVIVRAVEVADLGAGEELWLGGDFYFQYSGVLPAPRHLARLTADGWSTPGSANGPVHCIAAVDLGAGPSLYVGGRFTSISGVAAHRIARWNGSGFVALDFGMDWDVNDLAAFDDGRGPALFAGGSFTASGGVVGGGIARWDGAAWTALGAGITGTVNALVVHDDGGGPALFVAGPFDVLGAAPISGLARWRQGAWQPVVPAWTGGVVRALAVHDFGGAPELVAARSGIPVPGQAPVQRYDGTGWHPLGTGPSGLGPPLQTTSMASVDDGSGPVLWVCSVDQPAWRRWSGGDWQTVSSGLPADRLIARGPAGGQTLFGAGGFSLVETPHAKPFVAVRHPCGTSSFVRHFDGCATSKLRLSAHAPSARIGQSVRLGLLYQGPGGPDVTLFVSDRLLPGVGQGGCGVPVGAIGEVLVDGSSMVSPIATLGLHWALSLLSFGGALEVLPVAVPADPALIGVEVAFQALGIPAPGFGGGAALSNALVLTVTP